MNTSIYLYLDEHINLPFFRRTHQFTFPGMRASKLLGFFSHQSQSTQGVKASVENCRGSTPNARRPPDNYSVLPCIFCYEKGKMKGIKLLEYFSNVYHHNSEFYPPDIPQHIFRVAIYTYPYFHTHWLNIVRQSRQI